MNGTGSADGTAAAVAAAVDQIGPRLKQIRARRGMTLTGVAELTGISKSTLSRLETGQRRPTLELILGLSQAYRVPLDDLVGAPEVGDPQIRLKPGRVKGRTVIPLTRQPDGMQAWKIVIPTSKVIPSREPTTATSGSTSSPVTCDSSSATATGSSPPGKSPSSTPTRLTGSAVQANGPPKSSASSPDPVSG